MNPLTLAVSKVIVGQDSTATGFFYRRSSDVFFITNRHVVINNLQITIFPNFHAENCHIYSGQSLTISSKNVNDLSIFHTSSEVDICVIRLDCQPLQQEQYKNIVCIDDEYQTDLSAEVADDTFIIGYPHGHNAESGHPTGSPKPIWKRGTIATEMSLNYDKNNYGSFLVDATGQQGNSGSPVVAYSGNGSGFFKTSGGGITMQTGGGLIYKFIGIMSAILIQPCKQNQECDYRKSDLCLVWKVKLIEDIIEKNGNVR